MVKTTILVRMTLTKLNLSIPETKMDQNGPFWPDEFHLGLPTVLWPLPQHISHETITYECPIQPPEVPKLGVQETVLLVNHALARGPPAFFIIFVIARGSSNKALVLLVRMQIRHFRHFRQKPPFSGGTKARFTKSTVVGTPKSGNDCEMATSPRGHP